MATSINQIITLGIGDPGDIAHFILFGLHYPGMIDPLHGDVSILLALSGTIMIVPESQPVLENRGLSAIIQIIPEDAMEYSQPGLEGVVQ